MKKLKGDKILVPRVLELINKNEIYQCLLVFQYFDVQTFKKMISRVLATEPEDLEKVPLVLRSTIEFEQQGENMKYKCLRTEVSLLWIEKAVSGNQWSGDSENLSTNSRLEKMQESYKYFCEKYKITRESLESGEQGFEFTETTFRKLSLEKNPQIGKLIGLGDGETLIL